MSARKVRDRLRGWYRRGWRGYKGDTVPLRCRLGLHDWSPNLLRDQRLRICRNCVQHDRGAA